VQTFLLGTGSLLCLWWIAADGCTASVDPFEQHTYEILYKQSSFLYQSWKFIIFCYDLEYTCYVVYNQPSQIVYLLPSFVISSIVVVIAVLNKADDVSNLPVVDFKSLKRLM
jgi:hypothetical protein